jgi:hypothetical protein
VWNREVLGLGMCLCVVHVAGSLILN